MKKDFLHLSDYSADELNKLIDYAMVLKLQAKQGLFPRELEGKGLAMFFEKPSNRTRVSFDVAINQLGGYSVMLDPSAIQMGGRESLADVARTLSRYVDGVMMRTFSHQLVLDFAKYSSVPVINGLTDFNHPCQALGDILTIFEHKPRGVELVLAYVGDGNNMLHSLISAAASFKFRLKAACPEGYRPDPAVLADAQELNGREGVLITGSPQEAVTGADIVYTDVWTSMGKENEKANRLQVFRPYQINSALLALAKKDAIVMHCLPAHRGEEITDEVIDGRQSVVFDQAENRLHIQKAILVHLLKGIN